MLQIATCPPAPHREIEREQAAERRARQRPDTLEIEHVLVGKIWTDQGTELLAQLGRVRWIRGGLAEEFNNQNFEERASSWSSRSFSRCCSIRRSTRPAVGKRAITPTISTTPTTKAIGFFSIR